MAATFTDVIGSKYVLLTTFTKDGRPKPTPIRGVAVDDKLLVFTGSDSWKVKRLRNNLQVRVAACTFRGQPTNEGVPAVATLLDRAGTEHVFDKLCQQYGWARWFYATFTKIAGGLDKRIGIEIAATGAATDS